MSTENGNTPAFPVVEESKSEQYNGGTYTTATAISLGITKREHIAVMAMQAILSNSSLVNAMGGNSADWVAKQATVAADYLLAELERTK